MSGSKVQVNMNDVAVELKDLTKDYQVGFLKKRTVRALDHLNLKVNRGEIFGFLGPNGAGKTTTLKILMQLIFPTSGYAEILGNPLNDSNTRALIGYLPENPYFYDYLTGIELLEYSAALFNIPKPEAKTRARELLEKVGLESERSSRQLRKYSKGMLQRIGIAQSLINDPEIIFMDEPMSGLDPIGRREVRDLMLSLRKQNKTIFFSSHILSDVEALCDRAAILMKGKLVKHGTIQELTGEQDASMEVVAVGLNESTLQQLSREVANLLSVNRTPNGVQLLIKDESQVENIIKLLHDAGGKLISVMPRRTSLEEIFSNSSK
ncbi:MAG: ABC transporter ATP-binding protein [Acidobacteriota bacterium]